jgi:hypothetical protein
LAFAQRADVSQGTFEGDEAVAFEADEDSMTFTLTPELAAAIFAYRCTYHEAMFGSIKVTTP